MIIYPCGSPETLQDIAVMNTTTASRKFYGVTVDHRVVVRDDGSDDWTPALPETFGPVYGIAVAGSRLLLLSKEGYVGLYTFKTKKHPSKYQGLASPPMKTMTSSSTRKVCYGIGQDGHVYQFGYGRSAVKLGETGDTFCSVAVDQTGKYLIAARDFETHTKPDQQGQVAAYNGKSSKWVDVGGALGEHRFQSIAVGWGQHYDHKLEFAGSDDGGQLWGFESEKAGGSFSALRWDEVTRLSKVCMSASLDFAALDDYGRPWCSRSTDEIKAAFSCNIVGQSVLGDRYLIPGDMNAGWVEDRQNWDLYNLYLDVLRPPGGATSYEVALRFWEGGLWHSDWGVTVNQEDMLTRQPAYRLSVGRYDGSQPAAFDLMIEDGDSITDERFRARLLHKSSGRFLSARPLDDDNNSAVLRTGGALDASVLTFIRE